MTRGDFIANVDYFGELIAFCCDYGCTYCDDVFSDDSRDDYINEILVDMAADVSSWRNLRDILSDIPTGYDWYRRDDWVTNSCLLKIGKKLRISDFLHISPRDSIC